MTAKKSNKLSNFGIISLRIESELCLYPCHNLERRSKADINIEVHGKHGETVRWSVTPNSKWGMPGELAYKIDTQLINKELNAYDEIPKVLRLGSFRSIGEKLNCSRHYRTITDSSGNKRKICNIELALRRNASASLDTNLTYVTQNGVKKKLSGQLSRYQLFLSSEELPDGTVVDEVCVYFSDWYRKFLQSVVKRPLDYSYITLLKPTAQRFYELVSPKVFAAIQNKYPVVKFSYVEFCLRAPQKRYRKHAAMKRQMRRILNVHRDYGYIANYSFRKVKERVTDNPDWLIVFEPGPKALNEYLFFNKNKRPRGGKKIESVEEGKFSIEHFHAAELVKRFHNMFRGKNIRTPNSAEVRILIDELDKVPEEKILFWFNYAKEESKRTNYLVGGVKGILKYKEEAYDLYETNKTQKLTRKKIEKEQKQLSTASDARAKKFLENLSPDEKRRLLEQAEKQLSPLKSSISKERYKLALEHVQLDLAQKMAIN